MMSRGAVAAVILAVITAACSNGAEPSSDPLPSTPNTPSASDGRCPDRPDEPGEGSISGADLLGDVTGDGVDDVVYLVREPEAPPGCRDFIVVEEENGLHVTPLADGVREPSLPQPRLESLALVDTRPGAEILIAMEAGASTQFLGMFTMGEGQLIRVQVEPRPDYGDLFPYGGSVGHIEASDCGDEDGVVVVSIATPLRARYEVTRSVYRFEGPRLVRDAAMSEKIVVAPARVQSLPEFRTSPFGSCPQPGSAP